MREDFDAGIIGDFEARYVLNIREKDVLNVMSLTFVPYVMHL